MKVLFVIVTFLVIQSNAGFLSGISNPVNNLLDAATAQSAATGLLQLLKQKLRDAFESDTIKGKIDQLFDMGSDIAKKLREKLEDRITNIVNPLIQALSTNIASGKVKLQCFINEIPNINANINAVVNQVNATLNGWISTVEACGDVDCVDQVLSANQTQEAEAILSDVQNRLTKITNDIITCD